MARRTPRLIAPESYRRANRRVRDRYCNGCGGAGSWLAWLVPNHILGVCVRPACNIHDWMYAHAKRRRDKFWADLILLCNLLILCWYGGGAWLYPLRAVCCLIYYLAVTVGGRRFYGRKVAARERMGRAA